MPPKPAYRIFPLGDSAITIDFGNRIDEQTNKKVLSLFHRFYNNPLPGMIETVPAYSSITFHYDRLKLQTIIPKGEEIDQWLEEQLIRELDSVPQLTTQSSLVKIPVCYDNEFAPDLQRMAQSKNISADEIVRIHMADTYRVYMLGFLPGFAYLGRLDEKIAMPRKSHPAPVAAGSIGIAGNQTGIYPLASPGGWQIIGRTPLQLFDADRNEPTLLKAGDTVQFYSISKHEFETY